MSHRGLHGPSPSAVGSPPRGDGENSNAAQAMYKPEKRRGQRRWILDLLSLDTNGKARRYRRDAMVQTRAGAEAEDDVEQGRRHRDVVRER